MGLGNCLFAEELELCPKAGFGVVFVWEVVA
jgi:hypothetical protein